jgi:hypothetical protein
LPAIAEFLREDGSRVRIVILDQTIRARDELGDISPLLAAAAISASKKVPRETLRAAGDDDGMLPYARALSPIGKTCAQWRGRLTLERARSLIASCAKAINAPNRRRS